MDSIIIIIIIILIISSVQMNKTKTRNLEEKIEK